MPVISAASGKGGCAKTTTLVALARELLVKDFRVAYIDCDPNQHGASSLELVQRPNLTLLANVTEDTFLQAVDTAKEHAEIVLVDLPGLKSQLSLFGISAADFVLVPCQASRYDMSEAERAKTTITNAGRMVGRAIPFKLLWTRTPMSPVKTLVERELREYAEKQGIAYMQTPLFEFIVFREMMWHGNALSELSDSRAFKAALNIQAIAAEVLSEVGMKFPLLMPSEYTPAAAAE